MAGLEKKYPECVPRGKAKADAYFAARVADGQHVDAVCMFEHGHALVKAHDPSSGEPCHRAREFIEQAAVTLALTPNLNPNNFYHKILPNLKH